MLHLQSKFIMAGLTSTRRTSEVCHDTASLFMFALTGRKDIVWPTGKQMEIIDSLFHNFYVPPVIFAVMRDEDGEEVRVCVDGKQRLTSIVKFLDGHVCSFLYIAIAIYETHSRLRRRLDVCARLSYLSCAVCDGAYQTGILTRENSGGTKCQLLTEANETRLPQRERRSSRTSA
jgi:hypothetical protein